MEEKKFCQYCGEKIDKSSIICPACGRQLELIKREFKKENPIQKNNGEKFYQQDWFMWLSLIFFAPVGIFLMWEFNGKINKNAKVILSIVFGVFFLFILTTNRDNVNKDNSDDKYKINNEKEIISVADFSIMTNAEIDNWCSENQVSCNTKEEYSDSVEKNGFISQSVKSLKKIYQGDTIEIIYSLGKEPSTEYKNALKKATSYSNLMHMSKQGIYNQLTSEYGEQFPVDAAQYAIDNMIADWNANALEKAKSYQETMHMSKQAIYDQLISEYGEKFTASEAQYAIDHLDD